jgi:hypothetical protein
MDELRVWMDPIEFSQMLAVLHTLAPRRGLEWGSGGSTKAVLEHCAFVERWVSIEHDAAWHGRVAEDVRDPRLLLQLMEPDVAATDPSEKTLIEWAAGAETDRSVMQRYLDFPGSLDEAFDFVLVDGRARCFCIQEGFRLLRPGGVLLLHDAQREAYHPALRSVGTPVFLEPFKQGQIAMVRKPD